MPVYRSLTHLPQAWLPEMVEIYRQAFTPPPYNKGEEEVIYFENTLPEHAQRADFRLTAALEEERLLGFAYGYTSAPGQYWQVVVRRRLTPELAAFWLSNAFQLAEMALLPAWQGQGIGGALHDRILEGLPHRTAVLSTMAAETNAFHLYRGRGWQVLVEEFTPPGMARAYRVMGLMLAK